MDLPLRYPSGPLSVNGAMDVDDLEAVIRELAPPEAACRAAPCDGSAEAECFAEDRQVMAAAGESRRREFLAGRACARSALTKLGAMPAPIPRGVRELPQWPDGYLGSISHCKGLCFAAVARTTDLRMLGADLERTDRLSAAAARRVVHEREIDWVDGDRGRAGVLFSLKEAFYKAQFPVYGIDANFADVAFDVDETGGRARIITYADRFREVLAEATTGWRFRFRWMENWVVSVAWVAN